MPLFKRMLADWYTDPDDPSQLRYWNGQEWTEHTHKHFQPVGSAFVGVETNVTRNMGVGLYVKLGGLVFFGTFCVATLFT